MGLGSIKMDFCKYKKLENLTTLSTKYNESLSQGKNALHFFHRHQNIFTKCIIKKCKNVYLQKNTTFAGTLIYVHRKDTCSKLISFSTATETSRSAQSHSKNKGGRRKDRTRNSHVLYFPEGL